MFNSKTGLYLLYAIAAVMLVTATAKVVRYEQAMQEFGDGYAPYVLALVQLLIAAALLISRTRLLGVILAASYFGGVISFAWLYEGEWPIVGIVLNSLLFLGAALYRPALTNNLEKNA